MHERLENVKEFYNIIKDIHEKPFKVDSEVLWRWNLIGESPFDTSKSIAILTFHHSMFDGVSLVAYMNCLAKNGFKSMMKFKPAPEPSFMQ